MPVYSRKFLRQTLARDYVRDAHLGNAANTLAASNGSFLLLDTVQANPAFSGESAYQRAYLRTSGMDFRVASFNQASGAYITLQSNATALVYSAEYEVHRLLSPADKDRAIDHVIARLPIQQEYPINSVKNQKFYTVSINVVDVLDVMYWGDPSNSLDRELHRLNWWAVRDTPTGRELRIEPALGGTEQLILDALVYASLGSADTATVSLPNEQWVLYGAEAACWEFLIKEGPGKEVLRYQTNAKRAGGAFTRLTGRFGPQLARVSKFDDPV